MFGVDNSIVRLRMVTMRLKEWKRKLEPVENVELLHKELDAGGHGSPVFGAGGAGAQ